VGPQYLCVAQVASIRVSSCCGRQAGQETRYALVGGPGRWTLGVSSDHSGRQAAPTEGAGLDSAIPAGADALANLPVGNAYLDAEGAAVWRAVLKAIEELQRERGPDEAVS